MHYNVEVGKSLLRKQVRREVVALAMPVVLSSLLQRSVSIVDIFLVGGLGAPAIAAVGIGQLLIFISLTVIWALSSGTTVVVAQLCGGRRRPEAARIAFQSILLCIFLSVLISLLGGFFGLEGGRLLGAEPDVVNLADGYLKVIFGVFGFIALVNLLSNILYGVGDTRSPLIAVIIANVLHVLIAYPLIYGLWGAPQLGIVGAAIAVGISEAVAVLILFWALYRHGAVHAGRFNLVLLREVLRIGLPVFGDRALQQAGQTLYLKMIMFYGTAAYAAHQVGVSIEALSFMPGYGLSIAATTAVGQSLGANQRDRANMVNWEANRFAVMLMAGMAVLFFFFPYILLRLFTSDPEVIRLGTLFLKIVATLQIPLAITMVLSGSLKAAGDTQYLLFTTVVGSWVVRVPLAYLFTYGLGLSLPFVWSIMVVDWLVRMTLLLIRYRSERWHRPSLVQGQTFHELPD
ncbi:MAG TPA: MATE family efflux transporter [Nitrospiria bacterium]|nr:MATE family efflux transporter [Nitrospiria bacterium]